MIQRTILLALLALCSAAPAKRITVVAHRAAHEAAPENTLAAIRQAIEIGCDYVELDVRETRDGELVLMHDGTVDRTTTGTGAVAAMGLAEIRGLDAGRKRGERWAGEKVPTFDEALALCHGKLHVYVDHKAGSPEHILTAIARHGMLGDVVIYGSVESLRVFKNLRPGVWIMPDHPRTPEEMTALARDLKPETLDGNVRTWTAEQVEAAHHLGAQVWVDNLGPEDNEAGFRRAVEMGVDAIQTDHPALLLKVLKEMGRR
jgi:glycerophosphoryl diester phosphodiesterase